MKDGDYSISFSAKIPYESLPSFLKLKVDDNGGLISLAKISYKLKAELIRISDGEKILSGTKCIQVDSSISN